MKLSYRNFGKRLGVTHSTVARWESGDGQISRSGILALADLIGCDQMVLRRYLAGEIDLATVLNRGVKSKPYQQAIGLLGELSLEELSALMFTAAKESLDRQGFAVENFVVNSAPGSNESPDDLVDDLADNEVGSGPESPDHREEEFSLVDRFTLLQGFLNCLIDTSDRDGYSLAEIAEILGQPNDQGLIAVVEKISNENGERASRS